MKKLQQVLSLFVFGVALVSGGCKPDKNPTPQPATGKIAIQVKNVVGNEDLVLNTKTYTNGKGQPYTVSVYKYYLTNFVFTKEDGSTYTQLESYYLMDAANTSSLSFTIPNVPVGKYKSVKFMIGVDEARNTSGAQDGALSPTLGMIWNWNTGYIMAKMEGNSTASPIVDGRLEFHTGGFTGETATQQVVTLPINTSMEVSGSTYPILSLKSDLAEWFINPAITDFTTTYSITSPGIDAVRVARNYADMMSVSGVAQQAVQ